MSAASSKFSLENIAVKAGLYFRLYLFAMGNPPVFDGVH